MFGLQFDIPSKWWDLVESLQFAEGVPLKGLGVLVPFSFSVHKYKVNSFAPNPSLSMQLQAQGSSTN